MAYGVFVSDIRRGVTYHAELEDHACEALRAAADLRKLWLLPSEFQIS